MRLSGGSTTFAASARSCSFDFIGARCSFCTKSETFGVAHAAKFASKPRETGGCRQIERAAQPIALGDEYWSSERCSLVVCVTFRK